MLLVLVLSIYQYIICYDGCDLKYIEALSMIGLVTGIKLEKCEKENFSKIIAFLYDGKTVSSKCYFEEEIQQSHKIISVYINIAKQDNAIGKLKVVESLEEKD